MNKRVPIVGGGIVLAALLTGCAVSQGPSASASSPANTNPKTGWVHALRAVSNDDNSYTGTDVDKRCDGANLIYAVPYEGYSGNSIAVVPDSPECK